MSGHSRWSQIKRKKGKADVQRGKLFSKILREITVAAKNGGGDPKGNMRLKAAIESAKEVNMPADNIKRAVQKGTGELPGESYEEITYEGYAPGGVAVLVAVLTDNRNRTGPEIRHTFEKFGGNMGSAGAVAWMFERKGVIHVDAEKISEDDLLDKALEAGATDMRRAGHLRAAVDSARRRQGRDLGGQAHRGAGGAGRRSVRLRELRHPRRGPRGHLGCLASSSSASIPASSAPATDSSSPRPLAFTSSSRV